VFAVLMNYAFEMKSPLATKQCYINDVTEATGT